MFEKLLSVCILTVFVSNVCKSQVVRFGRCPEVETMKYFDLERFLGQWYEVARFPTWYETGECAYKQIQYCGRRIEINHAFVTNGIQYVLHVNSTYLPGNEAVFEIQASNIDPVGIPLSVISTDYLNYALIYGCKYREELGVKYLLAWILSREPTLSSEIFDSVLMELNSIPNANVAYVQLVEQSEEACEFHWTAHVQAVASDTIENTAY